MAKNDEPNGLPGVSRVADATEDLETLGLDLNINTAGTLFLVLQQAEKNLLDTTKTLRAEIRKCIELPKRKELLGELDLVGIMIKDIKYLKNETKEIFQELQIEKEEPEKPKIINPNEHIQPR